jgi:hypothetical protein
VAAIILTIFFGKEKSEKRLRKPWEQFISHVECDIYKIKQNNKILKHKKYESANINPAPSKETFYIIISKYGLLSSRNLLEYRKCRYVEIIKTKELKEAIKTEKF